MATTVFRNATVLPCTGDPPLADAAVVVEDDVIKEILTGGEAARATADEVVECAGRTLMPGLIDAHVHVAGLDVEIPRQRREYPASLMAYAIGAKIKEALDQGYTTVRDAGGADWGMKEAVARGLIK